jgi:hypothetical protein
MVVELVANHFPSGCKSIWTIARYAVRIGNRVAVHGATSNYSYNDVDDALRMPRFDEAH